MRVRLIVTGMPLITTLLGAACIDRSDKSAGDVAVSCDTSAVREVVERFGSRIQTVSLQGPESLIVAQIRDAYTGTVTPDLLAQWVAEPARAPGRRVSSPWPERIEIEGLRADGDRCRVDGDLVHVTSVERTRGGVAARDSVTVWVTRGDRWLVNAYQLALGDPTPRPPADDTTSGADDSTSAAAAVDVLVEYYRAIGVRDFRRAYLLWGDSGRASGQTLEAFAAGFAETSRVEVEPGPPGRIEGAAGSRYIEIPVTVRARTTVGENQRFTGSYTLRRSVVDGSTPATRRWEIHAARLIRAP